MFTNYITFRLFVTMHHLPIYHTLVIKEHCVCYMQFSSIVVKLYIAGEYRVNNNDFVIKLDTTRNHETILDISIILSAYEAMHSLYILIYSNFGHIFLLYLYYLSSFQLNHKQSFISISSIILFTSVHKHFYSISNKYLHDIIFFKCGPKLSEVEDMVLFFSIFVLPANSWNRLRYIVSFYDF